MVGRQSAQHHARRAACERNERGRRRIGANGRIADWSGIRVVRPSADADYCDFVVAERLLSPEQCDKLCRAFAKSPA